MSKRAENAAVTRAYLRRITGYEVTETKEEYKVNDSGQLELLKRTESTKHVPGDARAAEFWLTNRLAKTWRYRRGAGETGEREEETGVVMLPLVDGEEEG